MSFRANVRLPIGRKGPSGHFIHASIQELYVMILVTTRTPWTLHIFIDTQLHRHIHRIYIEITHRLT